MAVKEKTKKTKKTEKPVKEKKARKPRAEQAKETMSRKDRKKLMLPYAEKLRGKDYSFGQIAEACREKYKTFISYQTVYQWLRIK